MEEIYYHNSHLHATEKILSINGYSICVCITGNANQSIIFINGNSLTTKIWEQQVSDQRLQRYQLITFDLPGHGKSGTSDNYRMIDVAQIIPALVKELDINEYILVAFSYGTCLAAEVAQTLIGCKGILLEAANLFNAKHTPETVFKPLSELYVIASAMPPDEDIIVFAKKLFYSPSAVVIDIYFESYKSVDPAFRQSIQQTIIAKDWTDEFINLSSSGIPVCFVYGQHEAITNINHIAGYKDMWGENIFLIDNAGHAAHMEQSDAFNNILLAFAEDVLNPTSPSL